MSLDDGLYGMVLVAPLAVLITVPAGLRRTRPVLTAVAHLVGWGFAAFVVAMGAVSGVEGQPDTSCGSSCDNLPSAIGAGVLAFVGVLAVGGAVEVGLLLSRQRRARQAEPAHAPR